jgi:hypothetical protein
LEGGDDVGEEGGGVIVGVVEGEPAPVAGRACNWGPFDIVGDEGCFAESGGGGDEGELAVEANGEFFQESGAVNEGWPWLR